MYLFSKPQPRCASIICIPPQVANQILRMHSHTEAMHSHTEAIRKELLIPDGERARRNLWLSGVKSKNRRCSLPAHPESPQASRFEQGAVGGEGETTESTGGLTGRPDVDVTCCTCT